MGYPASSSLEEIKSFYVSMADIELKQQRQFLLMTTVGGQSASTSSSLIVEMVRSTGIYGEIQGINLLQRS
jgi:hypothetical protein